MVFLSWQQGGAGPTGSVGPGSHGPSSAGKPGTRGDQGMGTETREQTETRLGGRRWALVNLVAFGVRIQVL